MAEQQQQHADQQQQAQQQQQQQQTQQQQQQQQAQQQQVQQQQIQQQQQQQVQQQQQQIQQAQQQQQIQQAQQQQAQQQTQQAQQQAQPQQTIQGQPNQDAQQACIQQISNWDPSRGQLQVIPSLPNSGYLQYTPTGQIIMPSANFAVQQPNGQIQLISSQPKQIQSGQIAATPHMFAAAQGKQVIAAPGTPASFSGFTAVPTSSNNPQTIFISNLPNIIPSQSVTAVATSKQQDLQKYNSCATNRTVTQNAQQVQIPPQWQLQSMPPNMWATSSQPTFMTPTNAVYFRGGNQQEEYNQNVTTLQLVSTPNTIKRPPDQLQPKIAVARSILPSSPTMRAGSSVSTQTATGVQMTQIMKTQKPRPKANVVNRANSMTHKAGVAQQVPQQMMQQPMIIQSPAQQTAPITTATGQQVPQQMLQQSMIIQASAQQQQQTPGAVAAQQQLQQQMISQPMIIQSQASAQVSNAVANQQPVQQQIIQQQPMIIHSQAQPQIPTGASVTTQQSVSMPQQLLQPSMIIQTQAQLPNQQQQQAIFQQSSPQLMQAKPVPAQSVNISATTETTTVVMADDSNKEKTTLPQTTTILNSVPTSVVAASTVTVAPTDNTVAVEDAIKDKTLPRALVKPHVLTHVINGHIIQEADEPFPVYTSSHMADKIQNSNDHSMSDLSPMKNDKSVEEDSPSPKKAKLENGVAGIPNGELRNGVAEIEHNGTTERVTLDPDLTKVNPAKWTVADVYKFIKALPGCSDYADEFENQEIDGQALMLLKEDHLMSAMAMKLGPALKIVAQIDSMREESPGFKAATDN